jgi:predicted transglutaminase-like cysteine proteinase
VLTQITPGATACPAGQRQCDDWHTLKALLASATDRMTLLTQVNDAVNRLQYLSDSQQWALKDYWATPAEFFARRAGDCEDYAISKYFLLSELGVPVEAMRIAIVHDTARNLTHAVLVVQTDRGPMMLDNVIEEVMPAAAVPQYRTLLALNQGTMSTYLATSGSSAAGQRL